MVSLSRHFRRSVGPGLLIGLVVGAVAIGVGQLAAGVVDPRTSPVITVGQAAIDATPEWLKSFAIRTFGTHDKLVLLVGMGVVLALISIALGVASVQRVWVGMDGLVAFGALGVAAALTRPASRQADAVPAILGTLAAAGMLLALASARSPSGASRNVASSTTPVVTPGSIDRRRFFLVGAVGATAATLAAGAGNVIARRFRADASREAVRIPVPASRAATPSGVQSPIEGVGPFFTPNGHFYRVDTALLVPAVMAEHWRLRVHGMVDHEITLNFAQLLARPLIERDVTLTCVSNQVGGRYAGNARWIGAPLRDLLDEAGVRPGADQIVTRSVDGFTVGTPTAIATDGRDAMLAVAMNGEPLPLAHGFPVRMVVPGLYGYVSATKWVVDMELTTFDAFDPYWIRRGWAEPGPIKTMSRIDTPKSLARVQPGQIPVAGVAWAQHRGIARVELKVDGAAWVEAQLAAEDTIDTWRQWVVLWDATRGDHTLQVRATDGTGEVQTGERATPFPDGATGRHTIVVKVA